MLLSFLKNITSYGIQYSLIMILLIMWQMVIGFGLIPDYLLPSPWQIVQAFIDDFYLLMSHAKYTLITAFLGTVIGLVLSFVLSIFMDFSKKFRDIVYPVLLLNQTIPTIAIAPLLVIWLGYGILPKVVLVVLSVFFPMTIALVDGYHSVQKEQLNLFRSLKASHYQTYRHLKIPSAMGYFFTGLKVALSYALISAVVAEWLGGYHGLGVYMTRVRKSYELDNMFAVIFFISFLTLVLLASVKLIERWALKYQYLK
ncbi:ABC transporter permease [Moraxella nonliquefaciens]|jgi:ABC transporter permease protein|uniref:ABC transporter permease n=2 Tax=Moraxella nonliquefaciens TaxID=478 RepID=A0A1B8QIZ7_MORNO|nr:ABC transporter permease [Moraxella nonliquefaciens]OBX49198.1 nitrate ABC transporter permease [Moraxella nonliquefaciens]OBX52396.1 nitrate ABC transporter permease [Moraxella nonliquefaciens]OBX83442.1 nitrate ABC transporter permease [Moraxella nonliquefaciens]QPT43959.1 ABC transporter permease [Moraxella nonliquefaciens]QQC28979.1 ABC transporter permease [Moraxella nonliquefaciens]